MSPRPSPRRAGAALAALAVAAAAVALAQPAVSRSPRASLPSPVRVKDRFALSRPCALSQFPSEPAAGCGKPSTDARSPRSPDLTRRIVAISARYRGTPYRRDPLGEGPAGRVDRDPLICTTGVDCQTYVEQVLAEALANRSAPVLPWLTRIRYRDGIIGFGTRNHYMVADWLPHNGWLIHDRTGEIGGGRARRMVKVIDRAAFFRARGAPELGRGLPPEREQTLYIPRAAVPAVAARIPPGAVLIWVQSRPGIMAAHCGFAIRDARGALLFRHASELRGHVLDEPLLAYLRRAPARIVGLKVCQAVPPLDMARGPR